jgi:hypothetical protein
MKNSSSKIEKCQRLFTELRWDKTHAEQSARVAVSKAIWLGLDKLELLELVRSIPAASYLRQCPHILTRAWAAITRTDPDQHLTEFEQLLNAAN